MAGSQSSTGISDLERVAVLALRPLFSEDPIVFDVGSNKGGWADILIENVAEMHLFEPNEILLHYTMAKYDYLSNVFYHQAGVFATEGVMPFYYFTNSNNGLSSVYFNEYYTKELNLPMKQGKIKTITLDKFWGDRQIDFLKIDAEGADFDVLLGAERLLDHKLIKFIQIECSPHYALSGRSFEDVVRFVRRFGYDVFHFNGETFEKRTTQEAENFYIMLGVTQDWNQEFKTNTKDLPKFATVLEVGCFEGLTTNYICDNLLHEGGRVVCVDPLTDEYLPDHPDNGMFVGQYERFIRNTRGKPVQLFRMKSEDVMEHIKDLRFGLIYIDGDHTEAGVFGDAVRFWNVCLDSPHGNAGYMLFDDYGQSEETARGIDRFLESQKGNYRLLIKGYQVLIQRLW